MSRFFSPCEEDRPVTTVGSSTDYRERPVFQSTAAAVLRAPYHRALAGCCTARPAPSQSANVKRPASVFFSRVLLVIFAGVLRKPLFHLSTPRGRALTAFLGFRRDTFSLCYLLGCDLWLVYCCCCSGNPVLDKMGHCPAPPKPAPSWAFTLLPRS